MLKDFLSVTVYLLWVWDEGGATVFTQVLAENKLLHQCIVRKRLLLLCNNVSQSCATIKKRADIFKISLCNDIATCFRYNHCFPCFQLHFVLFCTVYSYIPHCTGVHTVATVTHATLSQKLFVGVKLLLKVCVYLRNIGCNDFIIEFANFCIV